MIDIAQVFPTPVGMNLSDLIIGMWGGRVPHTRGDEPYKLNFHWKFSPVFPTPVGMNRFDQPDKAARAGVPHTRGDEPNPLIELLT